MASLFSFKNISGTFSSNLVIQIVTVFQGVLLARYLGPEGRGAFAAIIIWPNFFAAIFSFGMRTGIGLTAAKLINVKNLYPSVIIISCITGVFGILTSSLLSPLLLVGDSAKLLPFLLSFNVFILLNHLTVNLLSIEHGAGNFKIYNILRLIVNPINILLLLFLIIIKQVSIENFVYALLFANALTTFICIIYSLSKSAGFTKIYSIEKIFKKSYKFGIADLSVPFLQYFDKAILLWFLGTTSLGFYTVALTASGVLGVFIQTIATISFTEIAKDKGAVDNIVRNFRLVSVIYLSIGILLAYSFKFLIPIIYGEEFAPAILSAAILIIASFFQGQGQILEQSLRGIGKPYAGLEARGVSLLVMIILGYLLAQSYGLVGVVLAFVIAQLIFLLLIAVKFRKCLKPNLSLVANWTDVNIIINQVIKRLVNKA